MRFGQVFVFLIGAALLAQAPSAPYKRFQGERILIPANQEKGHGPAVDMGYLDAWIGELSIHVKNWPINFANENDKQQAIRDLELLSNLLDILNDPKNPNVEFLRRAGFVNSMAHNLDVKGAAQKATDYFTRLLRENPSDPAGNYMYGAFLGGANQADAAIPYLLKADSLGVPDAAYSLGMAYLMIGEKTKSIEYFEKYKRLAPGDKSVQTILDALKNGKAEFKKVEVK